MEKSKTPQVSHPSQFSSVVFSFTLAICFVALIHVEIELHVHRQMLQVLNQQREDNIKLRKVVDGHEKTIVDHLQVIAYLLHYPSSSIFLNFKHPYAIQKRIKRQINLK